MINKNMDDKKDNTGKEEQQVPVRKPDEMSGLHVQAHVKIFDPESQEVYFAGRA